MPNLVDYRHRLELMEKHHPRSITALLLIVTLLSSCCIHKSATDTTHEKSTLVQNADRILLYRMASPQQQQDSLAYNKMDSIYHYKIDKKLGKVNCANTAIFNFLTQEEGMFTSDYPAVKQAFWPDYALKCYRNDKNYILLFSLGTEELRIISQDYTETTYKITKMKTILHWFDMTIPNDNYIKSILKWK